MKQRRLLVALLTVTIVATLFRTSEAITLACGDTIGPASGTFTLDADVGVCKISAASAAITIIGPARLDLNGHAVVCGYDNTFPDVYPAGIVLQGTGALVMNGTVGGCGVAVGIQGNRNRVAGMTITFSRYVGIDVFGDQNVITRNTVRPGEGAGVEILGDRNLLHRNSVTGPVFPPDAETTPGISATGDHNELRNNTVRQTVHGFEFSGLRTVVVGNTAEKNAVGFLALSDHCLVYDNVALGNLGEGFWLQGVSCIVRGNAANDNERIGIRADGAENIISANRASGNLTLDLVDENGDCLANAWRKNVFDTAEPACIE